MGRIYFAEARPPRRLAVEVNVTQERIDEGQCLRADKCMEKLSIEAFLLEKFSQETTGSLKVRIDMGHVKFSLRGYRYKQDTPKHISRKIYNFDHEHLRHLVVPHRWRFIAIRGSRIHKGKKF